MLQEFNLNANQSEYIRNATAKHNVKSFGLFSGAHHLDMKFMIPIRIEQLKEGKGTFLFLSPSKNLAKSRLNQGDMNLKNKPMFSHNGQSFQVVITKGSPKKISKLLSKKAKYIYADHMETWSKEVFDLVMKKVEEDGAIFEGTIGGSKVNEHIVNYLKTQEDLYFQDDFDTENNTLFPDKEKAYLIEEFSSDVTHAFKLTDLENAECH